MECGRVSGIWYLQDNLEIMEIVFFLIIVGIFICITTYISNRRINKDVEILKALREAEKISNQENEDEMYERALKLAAFRQFIEDRRAQELAKDMPGFVPVSLCQFSMSGPGIYRIFNETTAKYKGPNGGRLSKQFFDKQLLKIKEENGKSF